MSLHLGHFIQISSQPFFANQYTTEAVWYINYHLLVNEIRLLFCKSQLSHFAKANFLFNNTFYNTNELVCSRNNARIHINTKLKGR